MGAAGKALFAQSGGPTAVINSSICGAIQEARKQGSIGAMYGSLQGILGVLNERMIDLNRESPGTIELLRQTPSSSLGSSRHKLGEEDYDRILRVLSAHDIRYVFIAGGNDSMDTANRIFAMARQRNYELYVMGLPKTVDNDLPVTDHCPGYGSVARWLAVSVRDAGLDTEAIYTSDTIKVVETMGRNAGWITAATALARQREDDAPHIILLPEIPFNREGFLADVERVYRRLGYALITCCEGLRDEKGEYLTASRRDLDTDRFGHKQLGGVGETLCGMIAEGLKIKARADKPGTIQRVSATLASPVDLAEAYATGAQAVRHAVAGQSGFMVTLEREPGGAYACRTGIVPLTEVANREKKVPRTFINEAGNWVTPAFLDYATPLIGGPLPEYARLERHFVPRLL